MKLTHAQRQHLTQRLEGIIRRIESEISKRHPATQASELPDAELLKRIKAGKFKIRADLEIHHITQRWGKVTDILDIEGVTRYAENPIAKKMKEELNETKQSLIDDIILGDASEALQKLHDFETLSYDDFFTPPKPKRRRK